MDVRRWAGIPLTGVGSRLRRRGSKHRENLLVVMLRERREVIGGRLGIHLIERGDYCEFSDSGH
jgi:hypothetical protein